MPQSNLTILRAALAANGLFSAASGIVAIVATGLVAHALGDWPNWLILAVGIGLLGFASAIFLTVWQIRFGAVLLISILDILWVTGTVPLLLIPDLLSPTGKLVMTSIGLVVALFAALQLYFLRRALLNTTSRPGLYRHCMRVAVTARPDQIWPVIGDLGSIYRHSASLVSTNIIGGDTIEPGVVRVCENHQGAKWGEKLIEIDDRQQSLFLEFQTQEADFPFPFRVMNGGWNVASTPSGAVVDVWWNITPRMKYFGWLLVAIMTIPLNRDMHRVIKSMEAHALGRSATSKSSFGVLSYC